MTLAKNHRTPGMAPKNQLNQWSHPGSQPKSMGSQPPRNSVVASALMVTMLMYSAMK